MKPGIIIKLANVYGEWGMVTGTHGNAVTVWTGKFALVYEPEYLQPRIAGFLELGREFGNGTGLRVRQWTFTHLNAKIRLGRIKTRREGDSGAGISERDAWRQAFAELLAGLVWEDEQTNVTPEEN